MPRRTGRRIHIRKSAARGEETRSDRLVIRLSADNSPFAVLLLVHAATGGSDDKWPIAYEQYLNAPVCSSHGIRVYEYMFAHSREIHIDSGCRIAKRVRALPRVLT